MNWVAQSKLGAGGVSGSSSLQVVKGTRLYEVVLRSLLDFIHTTSMKPGDKFQSEREVASRLGVSRTVLREAFRILESSGVVRSRPGGGRYLASDAPTIMAGPFFLAQAQVDSLLDVWQARLILEVGAVGLVVRNATDDEMRLLVDDARRVHTSPPEEFHERDYDLEFHVHLARATHNRVIAETVGHYMAVLKKMRQKLFMDSVRWRQSCEQHIAIAEAASVRDVDLAQSQMVVHLQGIRQAVAEHVETAPAEAAPLAGPGRRGG